MNAKLDGVVEAVAEEVMTTVVGTVTGEFATVLPEGPVAAMLMLLVYVPTASPAVLNPMVRFVGVEPLVGPTNMKLLFGAMLTLNVNWLFASVLVRGMVKFGGL